MPNTPHNNDSEKPSQNSPSDSPRPDHGDDIDDLELVPISSRIPGEKSADSIPPKQTPTDDEVDDMTLDDISLDYDDSASPGAASKDQSSNETKSSGRIYPGGNDVDLTAHSEEKPAAHEPENEKKQPPIAAGVSTHDEDSGDFIQHHQPLPDEAFEQDAPLADEPKANKDNEPARDDAKEDPIRDAGQVGDDTLGTNRSNDPSVNNKSKTSPVEKISIAVFILLIILGLAIYVPQMIPEGQLTNDIVDVADTPIKLEDITIETLEARWTETLHIASRVRRDVDWTPEVELAISGSGTGAFRILFLDQDGRQRGDTMDIAYADGKFQPSMQSSENIYCTHGYTSELELKDLRARGDSWWTVRVMKGQDVKAPSSEFETVIEMKIPFEIVLSEK